MHVIVKKYQHRTEVHSSPFCTGLKVAMVHHISLTLLYWAPHTGQMLMKVRIVLCNLLFYYFVKYFSGSYSSSSQRNIRIARSVISTIAAYRDKNGDIWLGAMTKNHLHLQETKKRAKTKVIKKLITQRLRTDLRRSVRVTLDRKTPSEMLSSLS